MQMREFENGDSFKLVYYIRRLDVMIYRTRRFGLKISIGTSVDRSNTIIAAIVELSSVPESI